MDRWAFREAKLLQMHWGAFPLCLRWYVTLRSMGERPDTSLLRSDYEANENLGPLIIDLPWRLGRERIDAGDGRSGPLD